MIHKRLNKLMLDVHRSLSKNKWEFYIFLMVDRKGIEPKGFNMN